MQTGNEGGWFWENERLAVTGLSAASWFCLCKPKDQGWRLLICTGMHPINKSWLERPYMRQSNVIVQEVYAYTDVECVYMYKKWGVGVGTGRDKQHGKSLLANQMFNPFLSFIFRAEFLSWIPEAKLQRHCANFSRGALDKIRRAFLRHYNHVVFAQHKNKYFHITTLLDREFSL